MAKRKMILPHNGAMETLTNEQKVRILRKRYVPKFYKMGDDAYEDLRAFNAPGECYKDAYKQIDNYIADVLAMFDITEKEVIDILAGYVDIETKFTDKFNPPDAFIDYSIFTSN
jgi:hypothetical protein